MLALSSLPLSASYWLTEVKSPNPWVFCTLGLALLQGLKGLKMNQQNQLVWEILNAALYDLTKGDPKDAIEAIEEVINLLENKEVAM